MIPEQDGKVSNFVRYLVHQDGKGGDEAELEGGEEAGGDGEPVDEVVDAVGRQVEVAKDPLLSHLHLVVVLLLVLVCELKYLLEDEEGEDASEDPKPHHQQSCVTPPMVTQCCQRLREEVKKDVCQKTPNSKAQKEAKFARTLEKIGFWQQFTFPPEL